MSSWSCPHLNERDDDCRRLKRPCVPGRPGCVLPSSERFAVPIEQRIAEADRRRRPASTPTEADPPRR